MAINRNKQHTFEWNLRERKYKAKITIRPAGDINSSYSQGTHNYKAFINDVVMTMDKETPVIGYANLYSLELKLRNERIPDEFYELISNPILNFSENYEPSFVQAGYPIEMVYQKSNLVFLEIDYGSGYELQFIGYQSLLNANEFDKQNNETTITFYSIHKALMEAMSTRILTQMWKVNDANLTWRNRTGYYDTLYYSAANGTVNTQMYSTPYNKDFNLQEQLIFVNITSVNNFLHELQDRIYKQLTRSESLNSYFSIQTPTFCYQTKIDNSGETLTPALQQSEMFIIAYKQRLGSFGDFSNRFVAANWENSLNGGLFFETQGKSTYNGGIAGKYENRNIFDFINDDYKQHFKRLVLKPNEFISYNLTKQVPSIDINDEVKRNAGNYRVTDDDRVTSCACDVIEAIDSDVSSIVTAGQISLNDNDFTFPAAIHGNPLTNPYEVVSSTTEEGNAVITRVFEQGGNIWTAFLRNEYHEFGFYYEKDLSSVGQTKTRMARVHEYFDYLLTNTISSSDYVTVTPVNDFNITSKYMSDDEVEDYKSGFIPINKQSLNGVCAVGSAAQSVIFDSNKSFTLIIESLRLPTFLKNLFEGETTYKVNLREDFNSDIFDINGDYLFLKSCEVSLMFNNENVNLELIGIGI